MTVQFSGGEPTMSPHFLEGVPLRRRTVGYFSVQAATETALRFRGSNRGSRSRAPREAGLRDLAYFQFDGPWTNAANEHRHITNLFGREKRRANRR